MYYIGIQWIKIKNTLLSFIIIYIYVRLGVKIQKKRKKNVYNIKWLINNKPVNKAYTLQFNSQNTNLLFIVMCSIEFMICL